MRRVLIPALVLLVLSPLLVAQGRRGGGAGGGAPQAQTTYVLKPARVFDGDANQPHEGWVVVVRGQRIEAAGPAASITVPPGAETIDLPGMTVLPGLIEA